MTCKRRVPDGEWLIDRRQLLMLLPALGAAACVPVSERNRSSGSPQGDEAYRLAAAAWYRQVLGALSARGQLDDDAEVFARTRRVAPGLIAAAAAMREGTRSWPWEIHVTSNAATGTFCVAGGKILVESGMVRRLGLDDGELAMLLGHEMAHAVAGHRREAASAGVDVDAARELRDAQVSRWQEDEADEIGMHLAMHAGWPASALVGFFDKLAADEGAGVFNSSHATAASRASRAREIATQLERQ